MTDLFSWSETYLDYQEKLPYVKLCYTICQSSLILLSVATVCEKFLVG